MSELLIESDKAIVSAGRTGSVLVVAVTAFFLLIGGGILAFLVRLWAASGFDPAMLAELFTGDGDSVFLLVFTILGLAFTVIPCLVIITLLTGTRKPRAPQSFIFDNTAAMFRVWDKPWNAQAYALEALALPGYAYSQLEGFHLRSYTTSSSSDSGASHSTTHWVVCLRKIDGGLWDLHNSISKAGAEEFLTRLRATVELANAAGRPRTALPCRRASPELALPDPPCFTGQTAAISVVFFWDWPSCPSSSS